jgi:hypothetical protein
MSLSSVFTDELTEISVALIHIFFETPWDYVILTDFSSYSSDRLRMQTKNMGAQSDWPQVIMMWSGSLYMLALQVTK